LLVFDALASTNKWALSHLGTCQHGDVVWAVRQTHGRGRLDRPWLSPDDRGLTLSIVIIHPHQEMIPVLGQAVALAVVNTLHRFGISGELKWPNDILVGGKKIAGVLAEVDFDRNAVVLGIGLNVNLNRDDLASVSFNHPTTSMRLEKGARLAMDDVRDCLTREVEKTLDEAARSGVPYIIDQWAKYDWLQGHPVRVCCLEETFCGECLGLDGRGRLRVIDDKGREITFWAGDVERIESTSH